MAVGEWAVAHDRPGSGPLVAAQTNTALNRAVAKIRTHYQQKPGEPFPAKVPNQAASIAAKVQGEHQRAIARTDRSERSGELRLLGGQAPAGGAVRRAPQLGT